MDRLELASTCDSTCDLTVIACMMVEGLGRSNNPLGRRPGSTDGCLRGSLDFVWLVS